MSKGTIGILTGGGDVPGLNPAIRAITIRALRDGYKVIGIRHGWGGLVDYSREKDADNKEQILPLTEAIVNRAGPHRRHIPAHLARAAESPAEGSPPATSQRVYRKDQ